MTERQEAFLKYRTKMLPIQLDRARRKYIALVREAKRMKMYNLLSNKEMFDLEDAA
jgi:hypothetical protein